MKAIVCICMFGLISVALARPEEDKYTDKYDNVDLDEALKNDRLFENYFKCLMGTGKCTADGKELKSNLPDALQNNCAKCTDTQREGTHKVLAFLVNHKEKEWKELVNKYDPENMYSKKYEDDLRKIKS